MDYWTWMRMKMQEYQNLPDHPSFDVRACNKAIDEAIDELLADSGIALPVDLDKYKDMTADEIYAALSKKET